MTITDFLKNFPFIQEFKTGYSPYRSAGFFGFYLKGSPEKTLDMVILLQSWLEQFIINLSKSPSFVNPAKNSLSFNSRLRGNLQSQKLLVLRFDFDRVC